MITQYRPSYYQAPRAPSFAGRSIDDKPLNVENGSTFKEIDTGRVYRYDAENNIWIEQEGATPVQPAKPEQAKTVDLAMATGNQTVLPDEGKTLSSVTINKPATMIPGNIKKDINIGGVIGTYERTSATEPYIEETFDDTNVNLIRAVMHGYEVVRNYAFFNCNKLASVSLPDEIYLISHHAFENCTNLALTSLPNSARTIGYYAFHNCTNLALTSLPSELSAIHGNAFENCTSLAITSLPSGLIFIQNAGFKDCTNLTSIVFGGTPQYVTSDAFIGCTNLTDIKVPWAEGAVEGAPWGATNATITYNYTA